MAAMGGEVSGRQSLDALTQGAERARATFEELLPVGTPSEWVAIGGVDLFSEYERKVEEVSRKLGVNPPPDPYAARRQVEAVCVAAEASFDPAQVPTLTEDPDDDMIVWTALSSDADLLISDDRHVVPDDAGGSRPYAHGDRAVLAVRFGYLVDNYLEDVEWDGIDGRMLPQIYRAGALQG